MPEFRKIISKDNSLIKLTSLIQKSSKARKEEGLFVLEGFRICMDAAENGVSFDTLILSESVYEKMSDDILFLSKNSENGAVVSDELFKKISDTASPQGIIAVCPIPEISTKLNACGRYVALENISDPANLGAIARTAESLGINGLIITGDSCDIYSPKSLRASMGTLLRMPVFLCDDILSFIKENSLRGFACVAQDRADILFGEFKFSNGDVVIIGNEANGLKQSTKENAYKTITIPMCGNVESLNAASAASIAMWELMK